MQRRTFIKIVSNLAALVVLFSAAVGQTSPKKAANDLRPAVMWQKVNIAERDLFLGPGGAEMQPDLRSVTYISKINKGYNTKYRIRDASGRIWSAKLGDEAQPETVANRLLWALGYKTEIPYLAPTLTIPGIGKFKNVRLELHQAGGKNVGYWDWMDNPFVGTNELQGLKIMQVFLTNYDTVSSSNNKVERLTGPEGTEFDYEISDLGATFGRFGNNNVPIFYRLGRSDNNPGDWSKAAFITGVKDGKLIFATTGAKSRAMFNDITAEQGRWLYDLLAQLSEKQLRDAFRAANYSAADIETLTSATKRRIAELDKATSGR